MTKNPSQEMKILFDKLNRFAKAFGANNFNGNEINGRIIFVVFMGGIEQMMHIHGLIDIWPNFPQICSSITVYALIIQLVARLFSKFIRHDEENLQSLLKTLESFYEREEQNENHRKLLTKNLKILDFILDIYMIIGLIECSVPLLTAWTVSLYTREFMLPAPVYLPFINPRTPSGYAINSILLVFYVILLYVCFMAADVLYIFFTFQCVPIVDVLCMKIKTFDEDLMKVKNEIVQESRLNDLIENLKSKQKPSTSKTELKIVETQDQLKVKEILKAKQQAAKINKVEQILIDIIKEFNNYNDYLEASMVYMELTTFVATSMNSTAIGTSIVVLLYHSKAIGSMMVLVLLLQALTPCVLGTLISHQKEKLLNELYGFQWYELSLAKQKIFLQFLHLVQNSNEFEVWIIGELNMSVFADIINRAYSFYVYLTNTVRIK